LRLSRVEEKPTEADQIAATRPKVSLPLDALAVVSLKVSRTVPRASCGMTMAR
jgi:hypothetical protein